MKRQKYRKMQLILCIISFSRTRVRLLNFIGRKLVLDVQIKHMKSNVRSTFFLAQNITTTK